MKKVLCLAIMFLSFCANATYLAFEPTHELFMKGQRSEISIKNQKLGNQEIWQICHSSTSCVTSIETPEKAKAAIGQESFEIIKANLTGQNLYHNLMGQTVEWQLYQNGQRVGVWKISLTQVRRDGVRVYQESVQIPGSSVSSTTHIHGITMLSQRGNINGVDFDIRKL